MIKIKIIKNHIFIICLHKLSQKCTNIKKSEMIMIIRNFVGPRIETWGTPALMKKTFSVQLGLVS